MQREIDALLKGAGFRAMQGSPEEITIYYRYYKEGFHVVMAADLTGGYNMTPEQHHILEERVMASFYHPQELLTDFPEGFPVYHVEVLTLLIGGISDQLRMLCTVCRNTWAYQTPERRLLIYENQPGDFFGLRQVIEGAPDSYRMQSKGNLPYVTVGMVVVNVLVFLIMELFGDTQDAMFIVSYGGMYPTLISESHQWWRMLTAGFIHFGATHLINNMLILYCMGERLEHEVGHWRMLVIYIMSLLGGSLCSYGMMLASGSYAISAGASGAVFGVIGGFMWVVLLNRGKLADISAKRLVFSIVLMIYFGFTSTGIDNWGHIGGLVTGFLVTLILYHRKSQKY